MKKVEEIFAFLAEDDEKGEGVCGFCDPLTRQWMPMVGADMARVESLMPIARSMAKELGRKIKLVKFSNRLELEILGGPPSA